MKIAASISWSLVVSLFLAGCASQSIRVTEAFTDITQGYEKKRNMSKTEAREVLEKFLIAQYPPIDSRRGAVFLPDTRYPVFNSIDEKGYTLNQLYPIVDSKNRSDEIPATSWAPGSVKITTYWHWGHDGPLRVMFANVAGIAVKHRTDDMSKKSYDSVSLIYDNGERGAYWLLGQPVWRHLDRPLQIPDGDEVLSAFLALCPNVK
jgi:hypothetical protein